VTGSTPSGFVARVWAPDARRLRIVAEVPSAVESRERSLGNSSAAEKERRSDPAELGEPRGLAREPGGWWTDDRELPVGTRYGFRLDDSEDVLYDPRGRALPDGVHGLSQVRETAPFDSGTWAGRSLDGGVIYELHLGTFTPDGTLDSAIERLDHLVELGVDFVEPLPVNAFNGTYNWGYDGVAWFAVQQSYGGPDAYLRFVAACHARGLGVIQDVVYNHLGPSGNVLPRFGPYLRHDSANTWGDALDLTQPEVRRYILDNARMWFEEYGVDGLRLDAVHALVDPSPVHLLQELATETDALAAELGRPLSLIAESDLNDPVMIEPRRGEGNAGGYGLAAQWSDDYHHAVHVALTGETTGYYEDFASLGALAKAATGGFFHDGTYSSFREREHGAPIPAELPTTSLVTFSQDHDQIGNRATGDRLSATLSPDRLAVAAVLTVCSPFTPMIFMGEEWGASTPWQFFTSHPEAELAEATAQGRIAEFARMGWDPAVVPDPQDPETFRRSHLDWAELAEPPHARLFETYRELIALRRREPELTMPDFGMLSADWDDEAGWFELRQGAVEILVNLGTEPKLSSGAASILFSTSPGVAAGSEGVTVPPDAATVVRRGVRSHS
jgi:maltooligosyltrehalose trehalohydrolase